MGIIQRELLDLSRILQLRCDYWNDIGEYKRTLNDECFVAPGQRLMFRVYDRTVGGKSLPLAYPAYGLLFNEQELPAPVRYTVTGKEGPGNEATFVFALPAGMPAQWCLLRPFALDAAGNRVARPVECMKPFWVLIDLDGNAKNLDHYIQQTASFDDRHGTPLLYWDDWTPIPPAQQSGKLAYFGWTKHLKADVQTRTVPLTPRVGKPFANVTTPADMVVLNYVPSGDPDKMHHGRPRLNQRGAMVCGENQEYYPATLQGTVKDSPRYAVTRGLRGVFRAPFSLWLQSAHNGGVRGAGMFDLWLGFADGSGMTLAGLEHAYAPAWGNQEYTEQTTAQYVENVAKSGALRRVGTWDSGVPVAQQLIWRPWGVVTDPRSLAIDPNSVLVGGEHTHRGDVVQYALSLYPSGGGVLGQILKLVFDGKTHAPAKLITVLVDGLVDVFGMCWKAGKLVVAERSGTRVSAFNPDSGVRERVIYAEPNTSKYGYVDGRGRGTLQPGVTLAQARGLPLLLPEGLAATLDDADLWIKVGSLARGDVMDLNFNDGSTRPVCYPAITNKSFYVLPIVSGTQPRERFGPPNTVGTQTFAEGYDAKPQLFLDVPGVVNGVSVTHGKEWAIDKGHRYNVFQGQHATAAGGYGMCAAFGYDTLVYASSGGSIDRMMLRDGDPLISTQDDADMQDGIARIKAQCLHLVDGHYGYGHHASYPLFGKHPNIDKVYRNAGHTEKAAMGFKSFTKTAASTAPNNVYQVPWPTPAGQRVELLLHGSGGGNYTYGNSYQAVCDASMGVNDGMPFAFFTQNGAGYYGTLTPPKVPPYVLVQPVDHVAGLHANPMETNWAGYKHNPTPKVAHLYTHARLDALLDWTTNSGELPMIDPKRIAITGMSMGARGAFTWGLRRPGKFAAIMVTLPGWRWLGLNDWELGLANSTTVPPNTDSHYDATPLPDGTPWKDYFDNVNYIANNPTVPFPPLFFGVAKLDVNSPFQETIDGIAALRATNRVFACAWINGQHDAVTAGKALAQLQASYDLSTFVLGVGAPILRNSSLDTPYTADDGGINLGFKWQIVTETPQTFAVVLQNVLGAVTVDVLPCSSIFAASVPAQTVTIPAGQSVTVTFDAGTVVQPPPPPVVPPPVVTPPVTPPPLTTDENVANLLREARARGWNV